MPFSCFFFVLEKGSKSAGNAVIPMFPMHWSRGLHHLRHKRPHSLSQVKAGTHSASLKKSHTRAHTAKQGASLLCNRAGLLTVPHQAKEQPEEADARLRRVSASSGTAAPLGCVICLQLGDVAVFSLCAQYFLNVRGGGGITTLGALCVLLKRRTVACQNDLFAVF